MNPRPSSRSAFRLLSVLSAVGAVVCFNLFSITTANADAFWTNAIQVPGMATLNHSQAVTGPLVCTSSGNCVSGGAFTDTSLNRQAFLSQETNGVWSSATEVAAALNVGGNAQITEISCPVAGSCTAAGVYTDNSTIGHTFVVSQVNGTWGSPTAVPDFTTLSFEDNSVMDTLSCTSTTNCVGVGIYLDHLTSVSQPILFSETNGVWATPVAAAGAASLNPSGLTLMVALDCPAAGTCTAAGDFLDLTATNPYFVPFFLEQKNGVWSGVETVPGAAALTRIPDAGLTAMSCGAPGDCLAGGVYADAAGQLQSFIVSEVAGVWGNATQLFATQILGNGLTNSLNAVDCPSAGNCVAVGSYADANGVTQPFAIGESNHVWSPGIEIPDVQNLNDNAGASLQSVSCSAAGTCSAGGNFTDAKTNLQAFLVNDVNGVWSNPIEVPGTSSLNKGGTAGVAAVSCSGDGGCGAFGDYTDSQMNNRLFVTNSSATAPTTVSSAPRHVTATDKKGVVMVRWSAPASTGGAAITSYTVVSLPKSKTCVSHSTTCSFRGLNKKIHYSFEVRATNADGSSALSAKSNAVRDS